MAIPKAIESAVLDASKAGMWGEGHSLLHPYLAGPERGSAKYWTAVLLHNESGAHALDALSCLEESVGLLADDSRTMLMALLRGMTITLQLDDLAQTQEYCERAKTLIKSDASLKQWRPPFFYAKSMMYQRLAELAGYDEDRTGERDYFMKGIWCARKCLEFWETTEGPWNEAFKNCQQFNARMIAADLLLSSGNDSEAVSAAEEALAKAHPKTLATNAYPQYWRGLRASMAGEWNAAITEYFLAFDMAVQQSKQHRFLGRIAAQIALVISNAPERIPEFESRVRPLIDDAVSTRNVGLVDVLKRALAQTCVVGRREN